jgi:putative Holliday junction resolvase
VTRVLGVDYGTKRIGLALSDDIRLTAQPLDVVSRARLPDVLRSLAREHEIDTIVVGLPTGLGGNEGDSALGARQLASEIQEITGLEVVFVDERFTSRIAESALVESGMRRRERKGTVDKVAAAIILQAYLDAETT